MPRRDDYLPDPVEFIKNMKIDDKRNNERGKLKIFFGYAEGVGKTYAMLEEAHELLKEGVDVVVGYVEPHTYPDTNHLLARLPLIPPQTLRFNHIQIKEFDVNAVLAKKPKLILVDELAHTNAVGLRNKKRYQDIEELLQAGIDVYTTVNVQHIESLNDLVEKVTNVVVQETVPDYIFDRADSIELIDIDPEELIERLNENKIHYMENEKVGQQSFLSKENLRLLREISMRKLANHISQNQKVNETKPEKTATMKLIVCISASPSAAKVIRWGARMAEAFHGSWTAVYIRTSDEENYSLNQRKMLEKNFALAEKLGAKIIVLYGDDVAETIADYANISGITNIVIGKGRNKKRFRSLFEKDIEEKLFELLDKSEIHILTNKDYKEKYSPNTKRKWLKEWMSSFSWTDTSKMLGILFLATLISYGIQSMGVEKYNLSMIFILTVILISRITSGYFYGVAATLISVFLFDYLFVPPYFQLKTHDPNYFITFVIMLIISLIISGITARSKIQSHLVIEREKRLEVLYDINKRLLRTRGIKHIISVTNEYIEQLFHCSVVFYCENDNGKISAYIQKTVDDKADYLLSSEEQAVANWVFLNNKVAGSGTDTLAGSDGFYMPISSEGTVLGVLGIACKKKPFNQDKRLTLQIISSLVAMAMDRQKASNEQRKAMVENEREKMRSNLLRSISHDLRTPLTSILGASSAVLDNKDDLDKCTQLKLIGSIKNEAQWLIRMVENLLSVTKIQDGSVSINKTDEVIDEVVFEAISRIKKGFPNRKFNIKLPDKVLFVPMDSILIMQVLINLLENAIKHSPEESIIEVKVIEDGKDVLVEVVDDGEGIAEDEFPYLFEPYTPHSKKSPDASRGMGIGLSICMTIVQGHGGTMNAFNLPEGGAVFQFRLPLF
ncbi:DUF4118 domain-containing protein [Cytobacillus sp. Hz8]|uniref:DUF4118 domain-containing protein n=1 Tax=Cytobacillus sp. Hz8 TaxID=3347168 RepID=UPI0035DAEA32